MRRRLLIGLGLALAGAGVVLAAAAGAPGKSSGGPARFLAVKRHPVAVTLVEYGEVEAREVRSILAPISGVVSWVADEGTPVKEGVAVLTMDTEDLEARLEADRKGGVGQEGELNKRKATVLAVEKHRLSAVARSETELALARLALAEAQSHPTPDDKKLVGLDLATAKLELERAAAENQSLAALAAKGYVSEARAKDAQLSLVRARAQLARAESANRETLAGILPERLRSLKAEAKKAEMNLVAAKFNAEADVAMARESLATIETRWRVYCERLAATEQEIASAKVVAPGAGVVALVDVWKGSADMSPVQVGESHPRGRELLKIADAAKPRVRVHVNEADIARLAAGQPAEVRLRSHPGQAIRARLGEIAPFGEDKNRKLGSLALEKSGEAGVNAVDVLLDLELPAGADLPRLGSSAEVEITVRSFEAALAVPLSAVQWGPGKDAAIVRVRRGGGLVLVPVKVEATTGDEAVISEGLSEGDEVLVGGE